MVLVAWCETCAKFQEDDKIGRDGKCPVCGTPIVKPLKTPWHFKLLIVATVIYLLYRFVQLIMWLSHHL